MKPVFNSIVQGVQQHLQNGIESDDFVIHGDITVQSCTRPLARRRAAISTPFDNVFHRGVLDEAVLGSCYDYSEYCRVSEQSKLCFLKTHESDSVLNVLSSLKFLFPDEEVHFNIPPTQISYEPSSIFGVRYILSDILSVHPHFDENGSKIFSDSHHQKYSIDLESTALPNSPPRENSIPAAPCRASDSVDCDDESPIAIREEDPGSDYDDAVEDQINILLGDNNETQNEHDLDAYVHDCLVDDQANLISFQHSGGSECRSNHLIEHSNQKPKKSSNYLCKSRTSISIEQTQSTLIVKRASRSSCHGLSNNPREDDDWEYSDSTTNTILSSSNTITGRISTANRQGPLGELPSRISYLKPPRNISSPNPPFTPLIQISPLESPQLSAISPQLYIPGLSPSLIPLPSPVLASRSTSVSVSLSQFEVVDPSLLPPLLEDDALPVLHHVPLSSPSLVYNSIPSRLQSRLQPNKFSLNSPAFTPILGPLSEVTSTNGKTGGLSVRVRVEAPPAGIPGASPIIRPAFLDDRASPSCNPSELPQFWINQTSSPATKHDDEGFATSLNSAAAAGIIHPRSGKELTSDAEKAELQEILSLFHLKTAEGTAAGLYRLIKLYLPSTDSFLMFKTDPAAILTARSRMKMEPPTSSVWFQDYFELSKLKALKAQGGNPYMTREMQRLACKITLKQKQVAAQLIEQGKATEDEIEQLYKMFPNINVHFSRAIRVATCAFVVFDPIGRISVAISLARFAKPGSPVEINMIADILGQSIERMRIKNSNNAINSTSNHNIASNISGAPARHPNNALHNLL